MHRADAMMFLAAALGGEHFLQDCPLDFKFNLYDATSTGLGRNPPPWTEVLFDDWVYEGASAQPSIVWHREEAMDAFMFEVLAPAAKRVFELEAVPDRKVLFVALYLALVIERFLSMSRAYGWKDDAPAERLREAIAASLREEHGVDLSRGLGASGADPRIVDIAGGVATQWEQMVARAERWAR
jgi:hypothetical protein